MARKRPLQVEQALQALPELDELAPLRDALLAESRPDEAKAWAGSRSHLTLDKRVAEPERLEARIPELAERVRTRTEQLFRRVAAALRALEAGDAAGAARELVAAGEVEESAGRVEQAERYYEKALELGRRPRDRRAEGLAQRRLGRVARLRGELERAERLYRAGYEVAEAQRDAEGVVTGCLGVGHVFVDQGRWEEARGWYLRALEALPAEPSPQYLHLCNALSVVERRLGRLEESERWLARGESFAPQVADPAALGYLEHGRARLHLARGDLDAAAAVFQRALTRALDPAALTSTLVNLAEPLMLQGRLTEAEQVLRRAEELAIRNRVIPYLPSVYRALGDLARLRGDEDGFLFFEQALDVVRERGMPPAELATTQQHYGLYEARMGDRDAARARLLAALEIFRSLGARLEGEAVEEELRRLEAVTDPGATGAG